MHSGSQVVGWMLAIYTIKFRVVRSGEDPVYSFLFISFFRCKLGLGEAEFLGSHKHGGIWSWTKGHTHTMFEDKQGLVGAEGVVKEYQVFCWVSSSIMHTLKHLNSSTMENSSPVLNSSKLGRTSNLFISWWPVRMLSVLILWSLQSFLSCLSHSVSTLSILQVVSSTSSNTSLMEASLK